MIEMKSIRFEVWEDNGPKFLVEACDMDEAMDKGARRLGYVDYADMAYEIGWGETEGFNIRKMDEECI